MPEAPNYRELCDERGWPPIMGADGSTDEPAATDQPPEQTPAPDSTDQATTTEAASPSAQEDRFHDLDLSRIPDDTDPREWAVQREREMQQAFTRRTQEAAEARREAEQVLEALQDPETRPIILERLGVQVADPQQTVTEPEYPDPESELRTELDQLKGYLQEREDAEWNDQLEHAEQQFIGDRINEIAAREGRTFSEAEKNLITSYGKANRLQDGEPNLEDGYKLILEHEKVAKERYLESKRAPRKPGGGVPAARQVDPENEEAELEALAERYDALVDANQPDAA